MPDTTPHRVLIAGGGIGGLEAMIALRSLAGDRVAITLLDPAGEFLLRPLSVLDPFARPTPVQHPLARICADHGAAFVQDGLESVDADARAVTTSGGARLAYDALLVATGARTRAPYEQGVTFRGLEDSEALHGLLQDLEYGAVRRIAFVVPSGVTWALPLYELALMTAERASGLSIDVQLTLVTPEDAPLAIFGRRAGEVVERLLADAGIDVVAATHVAAVRDGEVLLPDGRAVVHAQRIVTLPHVEGREVAGLPADADGFLPADAEGRVIDADGVWAVGDTTTFAVKQGGIAAQQADAAARSIAAAAGADVAPEPFRPVLRAALLSGGRVTYLSNAIAGGEGEAGSTATDEPWAFPTKVAAPYLGAYLDRLEHAPAGG
jgi:sulfide:quinone oxidoreductase